MAGELKINGIWYDGATSAAVEALCELDRTGRLKISSAEDDRELASQPAGEVKISTRLGRTPRFLIYPRSGKFETPDNRAVDELVRLAPRPSGDLLHRLESRRLYLLAALALAGLLVWGVASYGLPFSAGVVADQLPVSIYSQADIQAMAVLDRAIFSPSKLTAPVKSRILAHFTPLVDDHRELDLEVLFRQGGKLGANAFALPGGTIVFTDEMVALSQNDDQLATVLAHEIGHVVHRHAMRSLIQNSLLAFMIMALTGDVSGTSELFLGLPVLLTEQYYSREFERQADEYALAYMKGQGIAAHHFADLMRLVEASAKEKQGAKEGGWRDYFSTHPNTEDRLKPFEAGQGSED